MKIDDEIDQPAKDGPDFFKVLIHAVRGPEGGKTESAVMGRRFRGIIS